MKKRKLGYMLLCLASTFLVGCSDCEDFVFTSGQTNLVQPVPEPEPVQPTPALPTCADDTYVTTRNQALTVNATNGVLANDTPSNLTAAFPANTTQSGVLVGNTDGSFTYTPLPGFVGTDTFSYSATNASGVSTCNVTITVIAPPPFFTTIGILSSLSDGTQADGSSSQISLSDTGNFVAFRSVATNLLEPPNPTTGSQIFFVDRTTANVELISRTNGGVEGDGFSGSPAVSGNGRFIAFQSSSTNLLGPGGDTNAQSDVFLFDRQTSTVVRISVANDGTESDSFSQGADISDDGNFVVFDTGASTLDGVGTVVPFQNVYLFDRGNNTLERISRPDSMTDADSGSRGPSISGDGRFIAFSTASTNFLPPGTDTNGTTDIYVLDRQDGSFDRVPLANDGSEQDLSSQQPNISDDGRFVAFVSDSTNLLGPGVDTNGVFDIYVFDRMTRTVERVSVASDGTEADAQSTNPRLSGDGRYVLFGSDATNLLGPGNDTNGVRDEFVYDRDTNTISRVSVAIDGTEANDFTPSNSDISSDGAFVGFASRATNLLGAGNDTNGFDDVFVVANPFR
jgi:hypothetical protein